MNNKKPELLAPAGNFSCFMAALNAGADAVYLGGSKFGARAYADNFTDEEIIRALDIAHLFGKKIYLTVNTLVKEKEMNELIPYITPFYREGLDGVIVQDIGVLTLLRDSFPKLALHASTQMTVTGVYGASFLKNTGITRVVPARELSLEEVRDIKDGTGLEVETFIHGAMCYSYSGQCLLSSILGGRSGNRGRCAGPCRLPYKDSSGNAIYPLSLKDMYTLPMIQKLIDAGIDSFKIEGRMKSAEYVAGVTSIYRKYIDDPHAPEKNDEEFLRGLYIRSGTCGGYYEQHNSKAMITLSGAGYMGSSDEVLESVRQKYLNRKPVLSVHGYVYIHTDEPVVFTLTYDNHSVTVNGDIAVLAQKRPLSEEDIKSRFEKLGDTFFQMNKLIIDTDDNSFLPVGSMNKLRRAACEQLEKKILGDKFRDNEKNTANAATTNDIGDACPQQTAQVNIMAASVTTAEQLDTVLRYSGIKRIYIDADLVTGSDSDKLCARLRSLNDREFYLALPHILRKRSYKYLAVYRQILEKTFSGVLVRNLEELEWLISIDYKGQIISDFTLYMWNRASDTAFNGLLCRSTIPVELNKGEINALGGFSRKEIVIYTRLALMYSANCIRKTLDKCVNEPSLYRLTDRYDNVFPIEQRCRHCYNILYNTVPMSLHNQLDRIKAQGFNTLRMDFTVENADETDRILEYYINGGSFPLRDYTNGHYKRGVE